MLSQMPGFPQADYPFDILVSTCCYEMPTPRKLFTHLSSKILFSLLVSSTLKKFQLSFANSIQINSYIIFISKFIHSSVLSVSNLQLIPYLGETFKTNMPGYRNYTHMECYQFMITFQGCLLEKDQTVKKTIPVVLFQCLFILKKLLFWQCQKFFKQDIII